MTPLNRKLYRDLWRLRGQVLAIALVIASGIAVLALSLTSMEALTETAIAYYERYRYGFASARDFQATAEEACACNLSALFDLWVYKGGAVPAN